MSAFLYIHYYTHYVLHVRQYRSLYNSFDVHSTCARPGIDGSQISHVHRPQKCRISSSLPLPSLASPPPPASLSFFPSSIVLSKPLETSFVSAFVPHSHRPRGGEGEVRRDAKSRKINVPARFVFLISNSSKVLFFYWHTQIYLQNFSVTSKFFEHIVVYDYKKLILALNIILTWLWINNTFPSLTVEVWMWLICVCMVQFFLLTYNVYQCIYAFASPLLLHYNQITPPLNLLWSSVLSFFDILSFDLLLYCCISRKRFIYFNIQHPTDILLFSYAIFFLYY